MYWVVLITGPQLTLSPWWTSSHGAARPLQGLEGHRDSSEREREEIIGVLINDVTWRRSWRDGHTTTLNRGDWWCSDEKIVLGTRMRDWSWGGWVG
jgi:hypothetical protein